MYIYICIYVSICYKFTIKKIVKTNQGNKMMT